MVKFIHQDCVQILIIYGQCERNNSRTCRTFDVRFPEKAPLHRKSVRNILRNSQRYGSLRKPVQRQKPVNNHENAAAVLAFFHLDSGNSTRSAEDASGISRLSTNRILRAHGIKPFKYGLCHRKIILDFTTP